MSENSISLRVTALIQPVIADLGLELYDLEYNGGQLKITIDTPAGSTGGIDVDQLSRCTRLISRELDHDDPVPGHYTLEVSSPGLERNLRLPRHFQREIGKSAMVRLRDVVHGERRLSGVLIGAGEETFTLRLPDAQERVISYDDIDRARTIFVWQAQPKSGKSLKKVDPRKPQNKDSANKDRANASKPSSLVSSTADSEQEIDDFLDHHMNDNLNLDTDTEPENYEDQESAES